MKIDQSVSSIYRLPERNQTGAQSTGALSLLEGDGEKRRQPPSISSSTGSTSSSLASALWSIEASSKSGVTEESAVGQSAADEFMEWSGMTLAEKIRAQILEAKGLTEEDLAAMDEGARKAIEDEIKEAIQRQLGLPEDGQETTAAS